MTTTIPTLREAIAEAGNAGTAIGHFNISDSQGFWGVVNGARAVGVPVIIGVSEGERDFIGIRQVAAMVRSVREELNYPVYLNADHTYSFERVKEVIDAGYDAVIFDGAKLSFEENARITKQCVDYARSVNPEIIVEAELGYIGSGSNIKESIPEGAGVKTKPEEAKKFVELTGVDMLAPSVGSIHGLIKSGKPHIDGDLVAKIKK